MKTPNRDLNLKPCRNFSGPRGPLVIVIMDGIGLGRPDRSNAVHLAHTPVIDGLIGSSDFALLQAHGTAVGLPTDADMGNSEVGHNAIGAGRVVDQGAKLVNRALDSGDLFEGRIWQDILSRSSGENAGTLHLIGLVSDGNVHSHIDHLYKMIDAAAKSSVARLRVHGLLDGRDVPPTSALDYFEPLEKRLAEITSETGFDYQIASGGGRMLVTMDRYEVDWGIVEKGWRAHVLGEGRTFRSATEAISAYRAEQAGLQDQFMGEFVLVDENAKPVGTIEDGDSVIFFNFRGDRAIEISRAFEEEDFSHFDRVRKPKVLYAGMMQYDGDYEIPSRFLVDPPLIERTMAEYLARNELPQFACSETQKFGHVTYFWNGNRGERFDENFEDWLEVPSYEPPLEFRPWMRAADISDRVIEAVESGKYRQIRLNYANGDMIGHTGDVAATVQAVEAVDLSLARLLPAVERAKGIAIVTADHGNADHMLDWDSKNARFALDSEGREAVRVSHSLNPVPFIVWSPTYKSHFRINHSVEKPGVGNIAATALNLMGYEAPEAYLPSLVEFN